MSASREKKNRQDPAGSGWTDPKTAREAQQRKEAHRTNLLYGTIGVVFLLLAIAGIVWKSNIIPKTATAVTINGESYSAAQVNYYYQNEYQSFLNENYGALSLIGLDTASSLKNQTISSTAVLVVPDATVGQTWYDYFLGRTLDQMAGIQAMLDAAEEEGFTWNDDLQVQLDENMESLETIAASYGYTGTQYLGLVYGSTVSKSLYEEETQRSLLANAYMESYQDSLSYSQEELESAYEENRNTYDQVSYESVRVNGSAPDTDEEGNTIEVTDEMTEEAMAAAKSVADSIYADYQAGGSLSDLAEAQETATYTDSDGTSYTTTVLGEWLFDDARQPGDSAVLEDTSSNNYYVVVFGSRFRQDYNTVDVRHILIQPEATTLTEDDEGYEEDVEAKDTAAQERAENILEEWKAGEATEESFAALANEYSQDPGSNTNGGLYQEIYQGQMVTEFNDWCFDEARQPGDTGIVHNSSTGYHVMYFVGDNIPYWQVQVSTNLLNEAVETWYNELKEGYTTEQSSFGMDFVG